MLGRQVTAALRRPLQARLRTTAAPQTPFALAIRTLSYAPRLLDQAGRPRKTVGEPSRPVKRAVKKTAKKPATPEDVALVEEKKRAAKEKLAAAKERQKKQGAAAKKQAREAAMTPEELERKKARLLRAEVKDLKTAALKPPFPTTLSSWTAFLREKGKELKEHFDPSTKTNVEEVKSAMGVHSAKVSAAYKQLSSGELEHYNHIARVSREKSLAEFKSWVESHSVDEIRLANNARKILRNRKDLKDLKLSAAATRNIEDERKPKRALTAYFIFNTSRQESGDFRNISVPERAKLLGQEWKALSENEKEKYNKLAAQDRERFDSEKAAAQA